MKRSVLKSREKECAEEVWGGHKNGGKSNQYNITVTCEYGKKLASESQSPKCRQCRIKGHCAVNWAFLQNPHFIDVEIFSQNLKKTGSRLRLILLL